MKNSEKINWHENYRGGIEFEHKGVFYRKGSFQCRFEEGDLVMNSAILYGPPSLRGVERTTGIVLAISQPDETDWPLLEVQWSTGEITEEKALHLWKIVRGKNEKI